MINIVIHNWKGYKKQKTFTTYWFVSVFNQDIFKMFDTAARRIDILLWYKKQTNGIKFSSKEKQSSK